MPDKFIVIRKNGSPSEESATISRKRKVSFFPTDSEHRVTITFDESTQIIPFVGWTKLTKTGRKGKPLVGTVRRDIRSRFVYTAKSSPGTKGTGTTNPELIVDGGRLKSRRRKPRTKKG